MPKQHDVDERHQFPEEAFTEAQDLRRKAVGKRHGYGQADEGHHARFPITDLGDRQLQERHSAIGKDDKRE